VTSPNGPSGKVSSPEQAARSSGGDDLERAARDATGSGR
jgi:hypothetical protein